MGLLLIILGFAAVSAVNGECDTDALLECISPLLDTSDIGTPGYVPRVCGALATLDQCVAAADCTNDMGNDYQQAIDSIKPQCQSAASCNQTALMVCVQPFGTMQEEPTKEELEAVCQAVNAFPQCVAQSGCTAQAVQYQENLATVQQLCGSGGEDSTSMCAPLDILACATSFGNSQSTSDKEATCNAFADFKDCVEEANCELQNLAQVDASMEDKLEQIEKECNGASVYTMSFITLLAALLFIKL